MVEILAGDQKCASQLGFDQNSFLIARGFAPVLLMPYEFPFSGDRTPCVRSFLIFVCAAGRASDSAEGARIPRSRVGGRFGEPPSYSNW